MGSTIHSHSSVSSWAIEIKKIQQMGIFFKVNRQRLKYFVENITDGQMIKAINLQ